MNGAMSGGVAALLALLAAGLAGAMLPAPITRRGRTMSRPGRSTVPLLAAVAPILLVGVLPLHLLGLVLLALGAGAGAVAWVRARRVAREAASTRLRIVEVCDQLAAELRSGAPPGRALERAAEDWPPLRSVAETQRIGGDVPEAFRALSGLPGAADLRYLAAAWVMAHGAGHGLAHALGRVAADLRADQSCQRIVVGELASARATARLMAVLPLLALVMGSGAGGDPWGFLFGGPLGVAVLGAGLVCGGLGLWWIESIARDVGSLR